MDHPPRNGSAHGNSAQGNSATGHSASSDAVPDDQLMQEVRRALSKIYHDLNNPLSIISGNAQFLLEISKEQALSQQFVTSIEDINEAADRLHQSLAELTRIREDL